MGGRIQRAVAQTLSAYPFIFIFLPVFILACQKSTDPAQTENNSVTVPTTLKSQEAGPAPEPPIAYAAPLKEDKVYVQSIDPAAKTALVVGLPGVTNQDD